MSPTARALSVLVALGLIAGCGDDDASPGGDLTVFAATSLSDAFTELGEAFEAANPEADVTFNFAASSELVAQINEGAPADVYASADLNNMTKLSDAGNTASEPNVFTTNLAEIVVGAGNPNEIADLADLADPGLIVVSCAPEVPCGRYAQQILDKAGVTVRFKSLEENVRSVVSKVALGEADAGIVYVTDLINAGDSVAGVEIPPEVNVVAEYPIAVTKHAGNTDAAQAFVDFVLSPAGQAILASNGFGSP